MTTRSIFRHVLSDVSNKETQYFDIMMLINNDYESLTDALLYFNRIRTRNILPSEIFTPTFECI